MKELTFSFYHCCDTQFKKLYGRYMRSLKKQYKKKGYKELEIIYQEHLPKLESLTSNNSCVACKRPSRKRSKERLKKGNLTKVDIIVRIPQ